jgi:hypothetical protein
MGVVAVCGSCPDIPNDQEKLVPPWDRPGRLLTAAEFQMGPAFAAPAAAEKSKESDWVTPVKNAVADGERGARAGVALCVALHRVAKGFCTLAVPNVEAPEGDCPTLRTCGLAAWVLAGATSSPKPWLNPP